MASNGQRLILAFDFGTRRIGVAVGNELLHSARELAPLPARDGIPDWNVVTRLIDEWQPDLFVVTVEQPGGVVESEQANYRLIGDPAAE